MHSDRCRADDMDGYETLVEAPGPHAELNVLYSKWPEFFCPTDKLRYMEDYFLQSEWMYKVI